MREGSDRFRYVMGHFATGVTIVTGVDLDGRPVGLTANAVASVSLDPKLVLVCMDRESASLAAILATEAFGISVLRAGQDELARRFSAELAEDRFRGLELRRAPSGTPFLPDALAWLECSIWRAMDAGDHTIVIGEVLDCAADVGGAPLIFFRGGYESGGW